MISTAQSSTGFPTPPQSCSDQRNEKTNNNNNDKKRLITCQSVQEEACMVELEKTECDGTREMNSRDEAQYDGMLA